MQTMKNTIFKAQDVIQATELWVENTVIELNLCPFAKRELVKKRIRFMASNATSERDLLSDLETECERLLENTNIETSLIIHPNVLQDFYDYNQFLSLAEALLRKLNIEGVLQIASFHPNYQFGGTEPDDAENYSNRSPFPTLHLLREESLDNAIDNYPDVDDIPSNNIKRLNALGAEHMQNRLMACLTPQNREH